MYTTLILSVDDSTDLKVLESSILSYVGTKNLIDNVINVFLFKEILDDESKSKLLEMARSSNSDILFIESNNLNIYQGINTIKL